MVETETIEDKPDVVPKNSSVLDSLFSGSELHNKDHEPPNDLTAKIAEIGSKLDLLIPEVKELKASEAVIAELSARHKELNEQFYEREVLSPILFCLIAIADRCHQQIKELQKVLGKHAQSKNELGIAAIKYLIDARKGDLVEIENILAKYSVESFKNSDQKFDPVSQKYIDTSPCEQAEQNGLIAQKLLPGYKRYEKVIRKECVVVYTVNNNQNKKGD
ncbi:MAG: nucleotide exchange factor GrpE [Phycisphaerae bacterium]|jgi:molecular chaperone GrpE (heat shock protein)